MLVNKTESVCPVCKKVIQADIVERGGSIFMEKLCVEHGLFEKKIAKYAWYYKGLNSLLDLLYLSDFHIRKKCFTFALFFTNKCNLECPICFSGSGIPEKREEVTLSAVKYQLNKIKNQRKIIRITGGEPTVREDLLDLIHLIVKSGNIASLFTNGLKLVDIEYAKKLKKAGLTEIIVWLDTIKNDNIHKIIRGKEVLDAKLKALENIKKVGIPLRIYHVKAKNLNDSDTGDCLEYAIKNSFIKNLWIRGYAYLGRKGLSKENEFLMDELVENVAGESRGLFTLEDAYYYQKIHYILAAIRGLSSCYYGQKITVARFKSESLRKIFDLDKFPKILSKFEEILGNDPTKAKNYFRLKLSSIVIKKPSLLYWLIKKHFIMNPIDTRYLSCDYFDVYMSLLYSCADYDKAHIDKGCLVGDLMLGPEKHISLCELAAANFS
jgi:MoaA/NifB/PqqE/SkfB family radical SAM enzyme